jgi:hypothetical protein
MAVRNPSNQAIGRLALEMKVSLFEGVNNAFQNPQSRRADVLFVCTTLMYAMDVCSHLDVSYIKLVHLRLSAGHRAGGKSMDDSSAWFH